MQISLILAIAMLSVKELPVLVLRRLHDDSAFGKIRGQR